MNTNLYFKKGTAKDGYTYYCTCGHIGKTRYHWYGNGEIEPMFLYILVPHPSQGSISPLPYQ